MARRQKAPVALIPANPPNPAEANAIATASERVRKRQPRLKVELQHLDDRVVMGPEHDDLQGFNDRLHNAFGTRSNAFVDHLMGRLASAAKARGASQPTITEINAALAFIDGLGCEGELEAMMGLNAYLANDVALTTLERLRQTSDLEVAQAYANIYGKVSRAATANVEALAKLRRGGQQTVKVVHVYPGGQAIVGDVHHAPQTGGVSKTKGQAHAIQQQPATPLLGVDQAGHVVSLSSDA